MCGKKNNPKFFLMKSFFQSDECERLTGDCSVSHLTWGWRAESNALVQLALSY